jgi:hypothetical protein
MTPCILMGGYQSFGETHRYHFKKYVLISRVKVGLEANVSETKQAERLEIFVHLIVIEASNLQNWRRKQYVLPKCSTSPTRRHGLVIANTKIRNYQIPRSRHLNDNPVVQLLRIFPNVYETQIFITVLTSVCRWSLSQAVAEAHLWRICKMTGVRTVPLFLLKYKFNHLLQ